jgi:hypothetical protein
MVWNSENEDGTMVKVIDHPHAAVLKLLNQDDRQVNREEGPGMRFSIPIRGIQRVD